MLKYNYSKKDSYIFYGKEKLLKTLEETIKKISIKEKLINEISK